MHFLNPNDPVEIYRGKLPHWRQNRVIYFVTFRLYDSLPAAKLLELRQERQSWLKLNLAPWSRAQREEYNERFNLRIQEWLDVGVGSCLLENSELKQVMDGVLKFFDLDRYELDEFCTMPIHVHVLVRPKSGWTLERIVHSWKSYSAKEINRFLGRHGRLWHREYFDHIVRHEVQLESIRSYIRRNPLLWRRGVK
jgi:REP element-mobilizing transposase RayT